MLVFPPAPFFGGKCGEHPTSVGDFGNYSGDMWSKGKGPVDVNSENISSEAVLRGDPFCLQQASLDLSVKRAAYFLPL